MGRDGARKKTQCSWCVNNSPRSAVAQSLFFLIPMASSVVNIIIVGSECEFGSGAQVIEATVNVQWVSVKANNLQLFNFYLLM